jgi:CheY-like chemotaxis protein
MIAEACGIASIPDELTSVEAAPLLCAGITTKGIELIVYEKASSLAERRMQPRGLLSMKASVGRILYVEDDKDTRELMTCVLAMNNYKVVAAENCDDALMLARSSQFDLYLIDNWMPGCSGIDLCKKLRGFNPQTPILFYSGAAYESDKQQAFTAGAQGYMVKPVDNDELIEQVSRIISAARRTTR